MEKYIDKRKSYLYNMKIDWSLYLLYFAERYINMSNKVSTRENFIETASRLFETKGYYATGLNEILKESGSPKGSLYYHFPKGKEELALEAIKLAGEKMRKNISSTLDNFRDPVEAIVCNIDKLATTIDNEQKHTDITISLISLETYSTSDILRKACEDIFISLKCIYAEKLVESGMNKERACELGEVIVAMIEGGITLSLTMENSNSLRFIAKQIPIILNVE